MQKILVMNLQKKVEEIYESATYDDPIGENKYDF